MSAFNISVPAAVSDRLVGIDLTANDAERLASLGVDPRLASAAGFRSAGSACAASLLARRDHGDLGGILIPYIDPRTPDMTHLRVWLDAPLVVAGSTTSYLQPTGSTNWLYFLPGTTPDALGDADLPILFCTSEIDALAASAIDGELVSLLPIAFGGPWGWRGTTKSVDSDGAPKRVQGPVEDLSRISLRGRNVLLCYPAEVPANAEAFPARNALLGHLRKQGARVVVLEVPPAADRKTRGLAEWIKCEGVAAVSVAVQLALSAKSEAGSGCQVSEEGITWIDPNPNKPPLFLASHFEVTARTSELDGTNCGRRLEFHDSDGNLRQVIIPMTDLGGDCTHLAEILLSYGVRVNPNRTAKEKLSLYVQREIRERIFVTPRVGWHNGSFVLPEKTIAPPAAEPIVYQAGFGAAHNYKVQGTLADWQEHVGRRCAGNSRLVFSVSLAFVGPLLSLVDQDSGGFHLRGLSSTGKSTALLVAGSVWGGGRKGFIQSWRATSNGLEAVAERHNDGFLCLDELSQVAPEEAGRVAYMLANGQGKVRMTKEIRVRPAMEWRLSFLSSGEISLADHLQTIRRQVHGGQEVRLIDLAADAGQGMGIFENLAGASSPDSFANELSSAALACYGSPIAAFLERLVVEREDVPEAAKGVIQRFLDTHVPPGACGEVSRAARRFALVAFAGEYASSMGVTGWEEGEAMRAAATCFGSWLDRRGSFAAGDTESAVSQVRSFITANGSSRFETICPDDETQVEKASIHNRAGFREEVTDSDGVTGDDEPDQKRYVYWVLPEAFRREVCRGFDPDMVAKALRDRGHLGCEDGRLTRQKRFPGLGKQRGYCILPSVLEVAN